MATGKNDSKNEYNKTGGIKIDPGMFIFVAIFIYIIICIVMSMKSTSIKGYQVKVGSLSENRIYTGIAIREEIPVESEYSGYINLLMRDGERAGFNNLLFCIDETGKLADLIGKDPAGDNSLSDSELFSLRQEIQLFSKNFDDTSFAQSLTFEQKIGNELSQIENRRIIGEVNEISDGHSNDIIDYVRAKDSGIVTFYQDGFELKKADDLNKEDFDEEKYTREEVLNDALVASGDFVYKYVKNEVWSIAILVPNKDVEAITNNDYVEVKFSKTLNSSWGKVRLVKELEKESIIELTFTNSMITFCKDRFVDIELMLDVDKGLKIPNSSIAQKDFFVVDKKFVTHGGNSSDYTVLREEDAAGAVKAVSVNIIKEEEDYYLIDSIALKYGDKLIMPNEAVSTLDNNTLVLGKTEKVIGVFNINKGYADFNRIDIKNSNDEYSIIDAYSAYGLRAYDYIALDASIVTDKDFVY